MLPMNFPNSDSNNLQENENNSSFEQNNDFFQIEFDDLIVSSNFSSDLFDQSPETAVQQLIIPQDVSIIDFLNDPVAFASSSSPEIVWSSIISPILSGKPETKPYMLQLITILFKYFKEHPISFIENEMNKRDENREATNREENTIVESHYTQTKQPIPNYEDFVSKLLDNDSTIKANINFFEVTQRLYSSAKENLTERHAFAFFKWGIFSEDISSILYSLSFFTQILSLQKRNSRVSFDFSMYKDIFNSIPLDNACFYQSLQTQSSSTEILQYEAPSNSSSFIGCDLSYIYTMDSSGSIVRINLSTENIQTIDRFKTIPLTGNDNSSSRPQIGIATSNDYAVVLGFKNKPQLYKLPDFEFVKELSTNQYHILCFPLTSDGYYIYSLQAPKRKLNIFVLNSTDCVFKRSVTLQFSDKKTLILPSKVVPQSSNLATFCNGSVFTVVLYYEKSGEVYKYIFRHFSVIDGLHLGDVFIESKWEILAMTNYPWDKKVFEVSKVDKKYKIYKLHNYSSQPLWLSRSDFIDESFPREISTAKRTKDAFLYVLGFLSYYTSCLHGFSFRSCINNPNYSAKTSSFFAPCTLETISTIKEVIIILSRIFFPYPNTSSSTSSASSSFLNSESHLPKEYAKTAMFTLFRLLEMNLSNFVNRKIEGKFDISMEKHEETIIDCLLEVMNNEGLYFLIPMVCFIIANSFQPLFRNPSTQLRKLFLFLYNYLVKGIIVNSSGKDNDKNSSPINKDDNKNLQHDAKMNEDLFFYMIKQISNYPEFASCLETNDIRSTFREIIEKLINGTIKLCQKEFLISYMRTAMLTMLETYSTVQGDFTTREKIFQDSFQFISNVVIEAGTTFFGNINCHGESFDEFKFDQIPFIIFFKKWLALLEPFPQFSRASLLIISFIQPMCSKITHMIRTNKIPCEPIKGEKRFHKLSMVYYEMFSLYTNSILALLNGGAEIKEVSQYEWLCDSSLKEKRDKKTIDSWVNKIKYNIGIKSQGVSFSYSDESSQQIRMESEEHSQLGRFINDLILRNPPIPIQNLMDYLHQKVKNPMNSRLKEDEKKIERIILAALIKQLGLTKELFNVKIDLEKNLNPVISHMVKQTMTTLYRIRNQIRLSKQIAAQLHAPGNESRSLQSTRSYGNYSSFTSELKRKAALLLNIDACFRDSKSEKDFPDMLKQVQAFITSKSTIFDYFKILEAAIDSSKRVQTGLAFLKGTLYETQKSNMNVDKICSSYMVEQLFFNNSIQYYLSNLGKAFLKEDVMQIADLFSILIQMIENEKIQVSLFPIITFFMNRSITDSAKNKTDSKNDNSAQNKTDSKNDNSSQNKTDSKNDNSAKAKTDSKNIFNEIEKLINLVFKFKKQNVKTEKEINSLLVFIASGLLNLDKFNNKINNEDHIKKIFEKFINSDEIKEKELLYIYFKTKMKEFDNIDNIFELFSNGLPSNYHLISLIIYDLITNSESNEKKIDIIYKIILTISQVARGCDSIIMKTFKHYDEELKNTFYICKYSPLIISGCSELIQLCRKLLNKNEKEMKDAITCILSNDDSNPLYSQFNDKKTLLYGVFAILSNLIEEVHPNSLIKNIKTNQIFYIESIDVNSSVCKVWQLPINPNSVQLEVILTSDFVPISLMPFQVNLFTDFSLLIPFFNEALEGKMEPALSILVLASLREYSTNQEFLQEFVQKLNLKPLTSIVYKNSLPFYLRLLHSHLNLESGGFIENIQSEEFVLYNAMNPNHSFSSPISTVNFRKSKILLLTSSLIQTDSNLSIKVKIDCQNYDIGVFCPSFSENTDQLFYQKRSEGKNSTENIRIVYNKLMGIAIIIEGSEKAQTFSKKIENPFCFVLNLFSQANVSFQLVRNQSKSKQPHLMNTDQQNGIKFSEKSDNEFAIENTFMSVPYNVILSLPKSLNLIDPSANSSIEKLPPVFYNLQDEIDNWQKTKNHSKLPENQFLFKYSSKSGNNVHFAESSKIELVNRFSGECFMAGRENVAETSSLPSVSLSNFQALPRSITNFLATGLAEQCRNESISWLFINLATATTAVPLDKTLGLFGVTSKSLLKHLLSLLLTLEPTFPNYEHTAAPAAITTDNNNSNSSNSTANSTNNSTKVSFSSSTPINLNNINNTNSTTTNNNVDDNDNSNTHISFNSDRNIDVVNNTNSTNDNNNDNIDDTDSSNAHLSLNTGRNMDIANNTKRFSNNSAAAGGNADAWSGFGDAKVVDFEYNGLVQGGEVKMTSFQAFSLAVAKIIEDVDKRGAQDEFADDWLAMLKRQFMTGFSHSCLPSSACNTSSVFVNMNREESPVTVSRTGVDGWIVCSVNFSSLYAPTEELPKDDSTKKRKFIKRGICHINGHLVTAPLTVIFEPELSVEFHRKRKTIVLIPIVFNSNDSFLGTFFELALSFKYFVLYITMKKAVLKKCQFYRLKAYDLFSKGIIAKSPFFFTYLSDIISFLRSNQPLLSSDIEGDFVSSLNVLATYGSQIPEISNFLYEIDELWNERILIPMSYYFPEFATDEMKRKLEEQSARSSPMFEITSRSISDQITSESNLQPIILMTKRVLKKFDTIVGFPYHILLRDWAKFTIMYPPYEVKFPSATVAQVTFQYYTPKYAVINFNGKSDTVFKVSDNSSMVGSTNVSSNTIFSVCSKTLFIECEKNAISSIDFLITSPLHIHMKTAEDEGKVNEPLVEDFIYNHRKEFTNDIMIFATSINSNDDQQILSTFSEKVFKKLKTLTFDVLNEQPLSLIAASKSIHVGLNVVALRAKVLIILNWLVSIRPDLIESDNDIRSLLLSVSITFKLSLFNEEINKLSYSSPQARLTINRKEGANVRIGASVDLNKTVISQMARQYDDPTKYRCKSDRPWTVHFENEKGIDVGGPARELVNECALDFMCPLCGLVVPVPNAVHNVGENRDFFIPIPSPKHDQIRLEKMYRFCGALIAICVRTGLVQQFLFPPLVWEYLLSGRLTIQRVFEIDKNYEMLITSLTEAMKSDMTNDEFIDRFNLRFVVVNGAGLEVPLTQRGKSEIVDKSSCNEFVALANRFRINELESSLRPMKEGFWSNLGIKPLPIIDWQTLEFAACGAGEISSQLLRKVTEFVGIEENQQKIFWEVVDRFSSKLRSDLLKFATGRVRLPPKNDSQKKFLRIDALSGCDILPTASTCFHKLHLPTYSSVEKAEKMIKIAIEYSGTFENS